MTAKVDPSKAFPHQWTIDPMPSYCRISNQLHNVNFGVLGEISWVGHRDHQDDNSNKNNKNDNANEHVHTHG